jgi:putative transposase
MEGKRKDAVVLSFKVLLPQNLYPFLEELNSKVKSTIELMLKNRTLLSSKYYKDVPCVVAKSLITKYQRNKKCKQVSKPVIPVCGDKGKQVKLEYDEHNNPIGIRIPALFKRQVIPITFSKPISGYIRNIEIFRRKKKWYLTYQYNTPTTPFEPEGICGVDRNSKENVATIAHIQSGDCAKLGPSLQDIKQNYRNRKAKLQKKGAKRLLKKISKKQLNRTKDTNHKVSRAIVDFAKKHRSVIVMEDLSGVRKGKIKRPTERRQWSYYQLQTFITYKAALVGIPIHYISPKNTSKECSRCGTINTPNGKQYKCSCGNLSHRDINAAFVIGRRHLLEKTQVEMDACVGLNGNPQTGKEQALCAS